MKGTEYKLHIGTLSLDHYSNSIFSKMTEDDIEYIKEAHKLGYIEYIYSDFSYVYTNFIIKIKDEFKYFHCGNDSDGYGIIKEIFYSRQEIDFKYKPKEVEIYPRVIIRYVEVTDEHICFINEIGLIFLCEKNTKPYFWFLYRYNLNLL